MKVKELIQALKKEDQESEVIVEKDCECYSKLSSFSACVYVPEDTKCGDAYDYSWTANEAGMDEYEREELKNKYGKSIVLWPTD